MNPQDRAAWEALRNEQQMLSRQMAELNQRVNAFASRLEQPEVPAPPVLKPVPPPMVEKTPPPSLPTPPALSAEPGITRPVPLPPVPARSLELKLGADWLPRIAVVLLLTGLVLMGNYAYHAFIEKFGALAKIALLYAASGALTATGLLLMSRGESLKNYARILLGGGWAVIYYTTYAAHFVEPLRVIESPLLAGCLLLALGAGMVWLAERRSSQALAAIVILLSYYTSAINPAAGFTLYSNLLLTAAASWFVFRHGWPVLSFASLMATYTTYFYWRFFQPDGNDSTFPLRAAFLLLYWFSFTVAGLFSRESVFPSAARVAFVALNNAAFFGAFTLLLAQTHADWIWMFQLLFGMSLLAMAGLRAQSQKEENSMEGSLLLQGVLAMTVAIVVKMSGHSLALVLAVESVALLFAARWRYSWAWKIMAVLASVVSCAVSLFELYEGGRGFHSAGALVATLLFVNAWQARAIGNPQKYPEWNAFPTLFSALGLLMTGFVLGRTFVEPEYAFVFALSALGLTLALYAVGLMEGAVLAQGHLAFALLCWLIHSGDRTIPSWQPWILLTTLISLSLWWKQVQNSGLDEWARKLLAWIYRFVAFLVFCLWGFTYLELPDRSWYFGFGGLFLMVWAILHSGGERFIYSALLGLGGLFVLIEKQAYREMNAADLMMLIGWVAAQRLARLKNANMAAVWIVPPVVTAFWVIWTRSGGLGDGWMSVTWAVLALIVFALGFSLRERPYRIMGFILIALAVGRVLFVDAQTWDAIYRYMSFMLLGIILFLVSYVYNRYGGKENNWL